MERVNFLHYFVVLTIGELVSGLIAWRLGSSSAAHLATAALLLGPVFSAAAIAGAQYARRQGVAPDFGTIFDFTHIATAVALGQILVALAIGWQLDPERLLSLAGRRALEMGARALFVAASTFALSFAGFRFGAKLHLRRSATRRPQR